MTDQLVSIRMPRPLVHELKKLVEKNHYMDLSEEIRSVVRQGAQDYLNPQPTDQASQAKKEEILRELRKLLEVER